MDDNAPILTTTADLSGPVLTPLKPTQFTFTSNGSKPLFTIQSDGEIVLGEGFTTQDDASLAFWDAISASFPAWKEHLIKSAAVQRESV